MATRLALVTEAARRLGDQSTNFLTEVDASFPFVLDDMAAREVISELRKVATFDLVTNQENYSTATMVASTAPDYPLFLEKIWIPTFGAMGLPAQANSDEEYERYRAGNISQTTPQVAGIPQIWRVYPNESQVQMWPPVDSEHAGVATGQLTYVATPTINASGSETAQIRRIFQETVVWGLMARNAEFKDENEQSFEKYWPLYLDGVSRMWGHRFNHSGGRIPISDAAY